MSDTGIRAKKHRLPPRRYEGIVTVSITACVEHRRSAFVDSTIVETMVELLGKACEAHVCRVPIYCFMPDHLHVMIQGASDESRALKAMNDFKEDSGRWFAENRPEFEWQEGYYDRLLRFGEFYPAARYILFNPIRAGLVAEAADFAFTGCIGFDRDEAIQDIFCGE